MMHPGIWLGFGDVDGNDYWRLKAKVVFDGFVEPPTGDRRSGRFSVRNRYLSEDGARTVCTETTRYEFERGDDGWWLRIEAEYDVPPGAWYFDENGYPTMPFAVLMEVGLQPCGWLASWWHL